MSQTGLEVFDKTLQTTNIWLNEISEEIGPDRQTAWAVLGSVLRALRDRLPVPLAANFSAELPLVIRGAFYDQYQPERQPSEARTADEFLEAVGSHLSDQRPVDVRDATRAVFNVVNRHVPEGQCAKVRTSLPEGIRTLWPNGSAAPGT